MKHRMIEAHEHNGISGFPSTQPRQPSRIWRAGRRDRAETGRRPSNPFWRNAVVLGCAFAIASCPPGCSSFGMPRPLAFLRRTEVSESTTTTTQGASEDDDEAPPPQPLPAMVASAEELLNGFSPPPSSKESGSGNSESGVDREGNELPLRTLSFDDVAQSASPPLSYEKFLTMQRKRVPVTIQYSSQALKPYVLTAAKRIKDQYPDVMLESAEVSDKYGGEAAEGNEEGAAAALNLGTFEVLVDGKIVADNNPRTHTGSIFVSMAEVDSAIARARKRRRPSTVYGENKAGLSAGTAAASGEDFVKSRLEALKQRSVELQKQNRVVRRLEKLKEDTAIQKQEPPSTPE